VIAIISILAAILFPVFASAREKARQTTCASNLHQIGLAFLQYEGDYDERLLPCEVGAGPTPASSGLYTSWWGTENSNNGTYTMNNGLLQPYMKASQIQACPSLDPKISTNIGITGYGYNEQFLSPYAANYATDSAGNYIENPITAAQIQVPTLTVVMADSAQLDANNNLKADDNLSPPCTEYPPATPNTYPNFHGLHIGMGNVLWADGHVKAMAPNYNTSSSPFLNTKLGNLEPTPPAGLTYTDAYFDGLGGAATDPCN
jgi:prepilin-type processing-associated H-X9-DG protein